jgi:hypothetical protein
MNPLERIKERARRDATRDGRPMAILNLNRAGAPLYVIRDIDPGAEQCREFVCRIEPGAAEIAAPPAV